MRNFWDNIKKNILKSDLKVLVRHARQRGRDSSGFIFKSSSKETVTVSRADFDILKHYRTVSFKNTRFVCGHSRLVTNSLRDNQPVLTNDIAVLHNGIITNFEEVWPQLNAERFYQIDTEVINGIAQDGLNAKKSLEGIASDVISLCKGTLSCAIIFIKLGKILLLSNNGSLYSTKMMLSIFHQKAIR